MVTGSAIGGSAAVVFQERSRSLEQAMNDKPQKRLYPVCPYCGKVQTLHKVGQFYVCRSCRRLTLKFAWGK